ncbi:unnamed protein product [Eruca vesicaria subsp. sativa]|uniref:Myb/SANT-like DNA-binding domain-containing protein n=1 Tax=Eruca vesicaria subsp. sativa TaxID=29727 RepID=A0ABC8K1A5_ERUVS|nr:unnamed protein product [Eruca vesicaria subsp. sativa]
MESNVMFSGFSPTMLTLEIPHQNPQNPVQFQHPHPHPYPTDQQQQQQQPIKPLYPHTTKTKQPSGEEDERESGSGSGCHPEDSTGTDGKRKISPWHRMKWTDTMVRLLIMAVFYIGDEAGGGGALGDQTDAKKKSIGMLQKKGKWKSVSRAMVEKGFSVSPQQCEDKFNDLNKRYKRVNDILGRGTACRVVENQGLLEGMDHINPKLKEEVKKLLNSKHLFFKEMCAYHNSCGHLDQRELTNNNQIPVLSKPECFHAGESERKMESDNTDSETEVEDTDEEEEERRGKKARVVSGGAEVKRMREETARVLDDPGKSAWEKKEWMRRKALELEERKVGYEWEAVEMEKQRVKWIRYRSKKEREMEKAKLENQRRSLETERMVLILRRREFEITEGQFAGKRVDPSLGTG